MGPSCTAYLSLQCNGDLDIPRSPLDIMADVEVALKEVWCNRAGQASLCQCVLIRNTCATRGDLRGHERAIALKHILDLEDAILKVELVGILGKGSPGYCAWCSLTLQ